MTNVEPGVFENTVPHNDIVQVYKKWHKYGLINIGYWHSSKGKLVEKVLIDIASTSAGADGKPTAKSVTKTFVPLYPFMAYLAAETNNTLDHVIPEYNQNDKFGRQIGQSFFGGSTDNKGQVISRVFKSTTWATKDGKKDDRARAFKCAHFYGTLTPEGGVMPIYDKCISQDMIRLTVFELAQIYEKLRIMVSSERAADLVEEI